MGRSVSLRGNRPFIAPMEPRRAWLLALLEPAVWHGTYDTLVGVVVTNGLQAWALVLFVTTHLDVRRFRPPVLPRPTHRIRRTGAAARNVWRSGSSGANESASARMIASARARSASAAVPSRVCRYRSERVARTRHAVVGISNLSKTARPFSMFSSAPFQSFSAVATRASRSHASAWRFGSAVERADSRKRSASRRACRRSPDANQTLLSPSRAFMRQYQW